MSQMLGNLLMETIELRLPAGEALRGRDVHVIDPLAEPDDLLLEAAEFAGHPSIETRNTVRVLQIYRAELSAESLESVMYPVKPLVDTVELGIRGVELGVELGVEPIDLGVDVGESMVDTCELGIDALELDVNLGEPLVNAIEPSIDLPESLVNLLEPLVNRIEPLVDLGEPLVDAIEPGVDLLELFGHAIDPSVEPPGRTPQVRNDERAERTE